MKVFILIVALTCVIANSHATYKPRGQFPPRSTGPTFPRPPSGGLTRMRFRREARPDPQERGSITLEGSKPLSGPDRRPSLDLNYNQRVFQNQNSHVDAYGGANLYGSKLTPHAGFKAERNFGNGFIGGFGQVQPGPRGRPDPTFGVRGGFRF